MKLNGLYDYSLVVKDYPDGVKHKDVLRIICPIHGIFKQKYNNHINGQGCPSCGRSQKKWTLETCKADAKKYKMRGEWFKYSSTAYNVARKNKWLDQCCEHMKSQRFPNGHWTLERCIEDAKKYKTIKEWSKKSPSAYSCAKKYGFLSECKKHMSRAININFYWTLERCIEDAKKYKTRTEWFKKSPSAFNSAFKNKWLDQCCEHMNEIIKPKRYWTLERCKEDAKKYKTRTEWQKSSGGYRIAYNNGWLDQCCKHMKEGRKSDNYWTLETCKEDALKYKTRGEWLKKFSAYSSAYKNGWLDQCCKHMEEIKKPDGYWTLKTCKEDALKYKTRTEWSKKSSGAYTTAHKNGWLDQCCKHMEDGRKR